MPRHIQILTFCENHPEEPSVAEHTLPYGRGKPRRIDVCEECEKGIVQPFLELLALGTVVDKVPAAPRSEARATGIPGPVGKGGNMLCPFAGEGYTTLSDDVRYTSGCPYSSDDRQAMSGHLRKRHNTGLRALKEVGITVD